MVITSWSDGRGLSLLFEIGSIEPDIYLAIWYCRSNYVVVHIRRVGLEMGPFSNTNRQEYLSDFRAEFSNKLHSQGIATLPSITVLDLVLTIYPIKTVLEIGRGLGTLTAFMGRNYPLEIYSIEADDYCIKMSAANCAGISFKAFRSVSEVPTLVLEQTDLVVIDGPISKLDFSLLFQGTGTRIFFFENHQLITKCRILVGLFRRNIFSRYVEVFPRHDFEGPSYVVSRPARSRFSFFLNNFAVAVILLPRLMRHSLKKLSKGQNPLTDSYLMSKWNPHD